MHSLPSGKIDDIHGIDVLVLPMLDQREILWVDTISLASTLAEQAVKEMFPL